MFCLVVVRRQAHLEVTKYGYDLTSMQQTERARKTLRRIEYAFALIAAFGAVKVQDDTYAGRWDAVSNFAAIMMIVGGIPFFAIAIYLHYSTPKAEREVRDRLRPMVPIDLDIWSWIICLMVGAMFETLLLQVQNGLLILILFYSGVATVFWVTRSVVGTEAHLTLILYIASSMTIPFSVLGLRNPELLATAFPGQLDPSLSRRISFLLFAGSQMFLGAGMVLMAGNVWRNMLLTRHKVTKIDFRRLNDEMAPVIASNHELAGMEEPLSDILSVVDLFQRAEFRAVFGWGWSTMDRLLDHFGVSQSKVGGALGLTSRIREVKGVRNKTVHAGYVPSLDDALHLLVLIRDTTTALSRINDKWVANLRSVAGSSESGAV
jgi:hypothetical protein